LKILFLFFIILFIPKTFFSIEALGGEISWTCAGGSSFVFKLNLYRDCNSADITGAPQTIKVWNHETVSEITLNFFSKSEISPNCTPNSSSLPALDCGTGDNGGNGMGAVEEFIYFSNPVILSGVPPSEGWVFTFTTTSRKASITNIVNPTANGMTLVAKMFAVSKVQNSCLDNSPIFLEKPYLIVCSGSPYLYMSNCIDSDLDSLVFKMVNPLNNFDAGSFNPPASPSEVVFFPNYSATSPTPGVAINGSNVGFNLNQLNGDISFTSVLPGEFVYKVLVESYRNGRKISEVEREIVVFVKACGDANTSPDIIAPLELGSLFEANFEAGQLVNFTLNSEDLEFLQDNVTPQRNFASVTSAALPIALTNNGLQGSSINVNWQTNCTDLKNQHGNEFPSVSYDFVFKVQDDFCQIPKTSYQRVTINLNTNINIEESQIQCITTLGNGDLEVTWNEVTNPFNDFLRYELHSLQNGLLGTFNSISTTSTIISAVNDQHDFFMKTFSGNPCSIAVSSDTLSNIFAQLFNPGDGRVTLTWNKITETYNNNFHPYYNIYREYPVNSGAWELIDSVPFNSTQYIDTIDICSANVNYKIELPTTTCTFVSNVLGDLLEDKISPLMPIISSVSIDTITGQTVISWNENSQEDTYGYVVYMSEPNGILFEIDTVYGQSNTFYSFNSDANISPLNFSIAAFDSCFTDLTPVTYQTSAKSDVHTSMYLTHEYDICLKSLHLSWTNYKGWEYIDSFEVYGHKVGEPWALFGKSKKRFFDLDLAEYQNYEFAILARDSLLPLQNFAFSNTINFYTISSSKPAYNYTRLGDVVGNSIEIHHYVEAVSGITELALEKKNEKGEFEEVQRLTLAENLVFVDEDVDVANQSYYYRVRIIDSCGNPAATANEVRTILLKVQKDDIRQTNFLTWNAYEGFNGSILYYNVFRGVNGVFDGVPLKQVPSNQLFCEDTIQVEDASFSGEICYIIDAVEGDNLYGSPKISHSNIVCPMYEPLIYIPTAFTPNEDGLNEGFKPIVSLFDIAEYTFTIIDRWGQVIFRTNDINEAWYGEINASNASAPVGTYIYGLELKRADGQEIIRRGHLTLAR
jgi:gliding motility-associated-like protein